MPNSLEAECAVLGCILMNSIGANGDRVWDLCEAKHIVPDHFYDARTRMVYETMQELARKGDKLDGLLVADKLERKNRLAAIGGMAFIESLIARVPTSAHAEHYLKILIDKYKRRKLVGFGIECAKVGCDEKEFADDNIDVAIGCMQSKSLSLDDESVSMASWNNLVEQEFQRLYEMAMSGSPTAFEGLSTGFHALDDKIQGLKAAEMIVIGARPSVGKTSLAMNIAECVALGRDIDGNPSQCDGGRKHPVMVFSLEMPARKLAQRMITSMAHLSERRLREGLVSAVERETTVNALESTRKALEKAEIYVVETQNLDIMNIRAMARRCKKQHGIELIIIDYLTLCRYRETGERLGIYQEVSMISKQIKAMAKELNVPVIVLSQLNRNTSNRGNGGDKEVKDGFEEPKMSDLRESGAIEQDADVVILMNLKTKSANEETIYPDESVAVEKVNVAKNRNGSTGVLNLFFDREHTRFLNYPKEPMVAT